MSMIYYMGVCSTLTRGSPEATPSLYRALLHTCGSEQHPVVGLLSDGIGCVWFNGKLKALSEIYRREPRGGHVYFTLFFWGQSECNLRLCDSSLR